MVPSDWYGRIVQIVAAVL